MVIRRILAKLMALCMVITSVLPSIPVAAANPKTYSVILDEYDHGKLAFYPEVQEKEAEKNRTYEAGEDVFLTIMPDEGYVLSDIAFYDEDVEFKDGKVKTEEGDEQEVKEKEVRLFDVEEKEDILGIQEIGDDYKVLATFEKSDLG